MNKFFTYLLIAAGLFFSKETFSFKLSVDQPLGCKFHNSRKCADLDAFQKELNVGCARPAGNCRYVFCQANCVDVSNAERKTLHFCKKNCFDPSLLARFDRSTRQALYENFYPSQDRSGKSARYNARKAYARELAVHSIRSQQWWRIGGVANTQLLDQLEAEYTRLISAKTKRLYAAKKRGDGRTVSQLSQEISQDVAAAAETIVQPSMPAPVAQAEETVKNPELSQQQRALASKILKKWWATAKGQAEARRVQKEREKVVNSIIQETKAPEMAGDEAKRMSGTWAQDSSGNRYFIPKAPPLPKSDKVKRLSLELKRQSQLMPTEDDLPPPPPPMNDEGMTMPEQDFPAPPMDEGNIPPAPPPPPSFAGVPPPPAPFVKDSKHGPVLNADLQAQIHAGKKLRHASVASRDSGVSAPQENGDARDALLESIRKGKQLKKTGGPKMSGAKSKAPDGSLQGLINNALGPRRKAIEDDDEKEEEKQDDDEWE